MISMVDKIQNILERTLTPKEYVQVLDLQKDYEEKDILLWVYYGKFKDYPIDYARSCIINKCKKKNEVVDTGSKWLNDLKANLDK